MPEPLPFGSVVAECREDSRFETPHRMLRREQVVAHLRSIDVCSLNAR